MESTRHLEIFGCFSKNFPLILGDGVSRTELKAFECGECRFILFRWRSCFPAPLGPGPSRECSGLGLILLEAT